MIESEGAQHKRVESSAREGRDNLADERLSGGFDVAKQTRQDVPQKSGDLGGAQLSFDQNGFKLTYRPELRHDRLSALEQSRLADGSVKTEQTFSGRQDGLHKQTTTLDKSGKESVVSRFSDGRRVEVERRLGQVLSRREYDSAGRLVGGGPEERHNDRRFEGVKPETNRGDRTRPEERRPESTPAERGRPKPEERRPELRPAERDRTKPEERRPGNDRDRNRPVVEVRAGESIQRAIERAPDGAIVHVQPGVYRERLHVTRDNITLKGNGKAVLDLHDKPVSGGAIHISNRRNVTIDGFEIRNVRGGDTPTGIAVDGRSNNISILNNNIHHVESGKDAHGISIYGAGKQPITNVRIEGNNVHHLKLGTSEAVVVNGNVDGFKILNNKVHDNDNIGIDVIGGERISGKDDRARRGVIANNQVWNIDLSGRRSAAGIYVDGGRDVWIENNDVRNATYGIEIASEREGWNTEKVHVRGNRIQNTRLAGITLGGGDTSNGGVTGSTVENNDLRGNRRPLWRQNNVGSDVVIRNNRY